MLLRIVQIHTVLGCFNGLGYLGVTALISWIVVDRLGLGLLRKAWINLDAIWAAALILTGCLSLIA